MEWDGGEVKGAGAAALATDLRTYLLIHAGIWNRNWEGGGASGAQNTIPNPKPYVGHSTTAVK